MLVKTYSLLNPMRLFTHNLMHMILTRRFPQILLLHHRSIHLIMLISSPVSTTVTEGMHYCWFFYAAVRFTNVHFRRTFLWNCAAEWFDIHVALWLWIVLRLHFSDRLAYFLFNDTSKFLFNATATMWLRFKISPLCKTHTIFFYLREWSWAWD